MRRLGGCAAAIVVAAGAAWAADQPVVVFAFDQQLDRLLRLEDLNRDGDMLDPGEVTVFMNDASPQLGLDNALGLAALDAHTVLATDNFAPKNALYLEDLNGDGDALDPDEARVWWNGNLPGGLHITLPMSLTAAPDGSYYVVDNNTLDSANPESAYRVRDDNANGRIDPNQGEVTEFFQFEPAGGSFVSNIFDIELRNNGSGIVMDAISSDVRLRLINADGSAISDFVTDDQFFALSGGWVIDFTLADMAHDPDTDEIIIPMFRGNFVIGILALVDRNGSRTINNASEWRLLWDEGLNADGFSSGSPRDLVLARDGSLLWVDALSDRVWRLIDRNGDGDYNDVGETTYIYDSGEALAAGLPEAPNLLSLAVVTLCPADVTGDGRTDLDDLLTILANFGMSPATFGQGDLDGDDAVDLDDLLLLLSAFGQTCV